MQCPHHSQKLQERNIIRDFRRRGMKVRKIKGRGLVGPGFYACSRKRTYLERHMGKIRPMTLLMRKPPDRRFLLFRTGAVIYTQ